jgi:hypothetical protein
MNMANNEVGVNSRAIAGEIISWLFGAIAMAIGIINIFWGNDPGYGIFIVVLSFIYFPPSAAFFKKISGIPIRLIIKIILAVFILWSALGVGELFNKIALMRMSF